MCVCVCLSLSHIYIYSLYIYIYIYVHKIEFTRSGQENICSADVHCQGSGACYDFVKATTKLPQYPHDIKSYTSRTIPFKLLNEPKINP